MVQRHPLSKRDRESLVARASELYPPLGKALDRAEKIELLKIKLDSRKVVVYLVDGFPALVEESGIMYPTIFLIRRLRWSPCVIVDAGAAPRVASGADVMVPGIVKVEGEFDKDAVVAVYDENGRPLAVCRALMSKEEILSSNRGRALKNLHHPEDRLVKALRAVLQP